RVATSGAILSTPTFAKIAVSAAKHADNSAHTSHVDTKGFSRCPMASLSVKCSSARKVGERQPKARRNLAHLESVDPGAVVPASQHRRNTQHMDSKTYGLTRRALPTARQARIVLLIALCAAGILAVGWGAARLRAAQPASSATAGTVADNGLHLTPAQLSVPTLHTPSP